jgi:hypothetical protein
MKKFLALLLSSFICLPALSDGESVEFEEITGISSSSSLLNNELQEYNKKVAKDMIKAIDDKKLNVYQHTEIQINQIASKGYYIFKNTKKDEFGNEIIEEHNTYGSKELMQVLEKLVNSPEIDTNKPFTLTSLFRFGGNHGELQKNGDLIGRAVDIYSYAGAKIHINNPNEALEGITKIIQTLPPSRYTLGLPRPGGLNVIDPNSDYFLPVETLSQSRISPTGTIKGDLEKVKNPDAKIKLSNVINTNSQASILFMYPDAPDHLHIKVVEQGKIQ